jgi:hypothetical protein
VSFECNVNDLLPRLQRWYSSQCDGDWEHHSGIDIGTLDNPGWTLKVSLKRTPLQGRQFAPLEYGLDRKNANWLSCRVEKDEFQGAGGPDKLADLCRAQASAFSQPDSRTSTPSSFRGIARRLNAQYYMAHRFVQQPTENTRRLAASDAPPGSKDVPEEVQSRTTIGRSRERAIPQQSGRPAPPVLEPVFSCPHGFLCS